MSNCNCIEKVVAAMKEVAAEWKRPELTDLAARIEVRAIKYAARRALEQAAEPGVERPAPASTPAFDAGGLATEVARELQDNLLIWGQGRPTAKLPDNATCRIMTALTAAHADGDAAGYERGKAEQRAPEGCVINQNSEVLVAEPVHAAPYPFNPRHYTTEWLWRLTKQPAAPDAKEAGR